MEILPSRYRELTHAEKTLQEIRYLIRYEKEKKPEYKMPADQMVAQIEWIIKMSEGRIDK